MVMAKMYSNGQIGPVSIQIMPFYGFFSLYFFFLKFGGLREMDF